MSAPKVILDLVEVFQRNRAAYHEPRYNEAQVRQEFINPFFEALGWDVANTQRFAPDYREVIHEDALRVSGAMKAPDYSFGFGRDRKFFLEAKKPAVDIHKNPEPAFQLRRYAWNAKTMPLAILTDFEEFAIYNCRTRPSQQDKASVDRIEYFTCEAYPEKWDFIAGIFSPDAIRQGSFDKYTESTRGKRGTAEVDVAFLAEIEHWRELLAKNFGLRKSRQLRGEANRPSAFHDLAIHGDWPRLAVALQSSKRGHSQTNTRSMDSKLSLAQTAVNSLRRGDDQA